MMCSRNNYTMPPRRGPGIVFLIVPFIVLAFLFIFFMRASVTQTSTPATVYVPAAPQQDSAEPEPSPDASEVLLADVYPSEELAIRALGRLLPEAIAEAESNPRGILISCPSHDNEGAIIESLLSKSFPSTAFSRDPAAVSANDPGWVKLTVRIDNTGVFAGNDFRPLRGKVTIEVVPGAHAPLSTRFIYRPWAADPAGYFNDNPNGDSIIGRCGKPMLSEPAARQAAEADAMRQAVTLIQRHALNRGANFTGRQEDTAYLMDDLRQNLPVKDRFVQQFHRPYGNTWTESVLVDASPGWLESMSQRHAVAMYQHETRVKTTFASTLIVLITIVIAYLFLNAVTKSYFTWRLRTAAIVCAAAAIVIAMSALRMA